MSDLRTDLQVLLVEDDGMVRASVKSYLERHGIAVEAVAYGEKGIARAASKRFDVILLDILLPDIDGREVCRRIRQMGIWTPVIMLTALAGDDDTIKGLDAGANDYVEKSALDLDGASRGRFANDYVEKPFRPMVLLARIRAHLRQHDRSEDAEFEFGAFRFRPGAKELVDREGQRTRLTEKETELLKCLLRAEPRAVSRNELLEEVWGYSPSIATHTLETHVYRLRRKLDPEGSGETILATEPGGYRLLRPAGAAPPG